MFGDINRVDLMGNITRDIELRHTSSGTSVCSFTIATNRRYRVEDEWKEETQFHNVVAWANQAEQLSQRAKKGTRIYVEGRLQTRSWQNDAGEQRYTTEIIANRIILIDRYEKGAGGEYEGGGSPAGEAAPAPEMANPDDAAKRSKKPAETKSSSNAEEKIDPDDLPF